MTVVLGGFFVKSCMRASNTLSILRCSSAIFLKLPLKHHVMQRSLYAFLCVIFQTVRACSSNELFPETLTPKAGVQLAHSDAMYDNVGVLHIDMQTLGIAHGQATVTYIGGRTCLTAAHNLQSPIVSDPLFFRNLFLGFVYRYNACFKPSLRVGFKVKGEISYYEVLNYTIYPEYADRKSHADLAILQLDREVKGLTGLPLSYDFGENEICLRNVYEDITPENKGEHIPYPLTYVGYGDVHSLTALKDVYNHRTASRSFLVSVLNGLGATFLYSACRGTNIYVIDAKTNASKRRNLLPYEIGTMPGMSGGPTIYNGNVIAIHSFSLLRYVDSAYQREMNFKTYANYCIWLINFLIPPFWWRPITLYSVDNIHFGQVSASVPLGPYRKWIEDTKHHFDL